jgi:hypothetical protein
MDQKVYELLNGIPEEADYAVSAGDLDPEDIPLNRIEAVKELLLDTVSDDERFFAAKLLTSWGIHEGLVALERSMESPESLEGTYSHRLHGYDDTYCQILMAVTRYFANVADRGDTDLARAQVFSPLTKIIELSNSKPFEIGKIFDFVVNEKYLEYLPYIRNHLSLIIDHPDIHRWKIYDAIECLLKLDSKFVMSLLKEKNKTVEDFRPSVAR